MASKPDALKPSVPETADALVRLVTDPKTDPKARDDAYGRIYALPEREQINVLRQILAVDTPFTRKYTSYVVGPADQLIEWDDVDSVSRIARMVSRWPPSEQRDVLGRIEKKYFAPLPRAQLPTTVVPYLPIVRQVAAYLLQPDVVAKAFDGEADKVDETGNPDQRLQVDLPDKVAQLLAQGEVPSDKRALRALLSHYPNSYGAWQFAAQAGLVTQADVAVARSVYSNPKKSDVLRLAAAVAVADFAPDAEKYVADYVSGMLADYPDDAHSPKNPFLKPPTLPAPKSDTVDSEAFDKQLKAWAVYDNKLTNLEVLESLSPAKLTPIALKAMQSESPDIAGSLSYTAIQVVPSLLLNGPPRILPESRVQNQYAIMVISYPELRAQAEAIVPKDQLDKAIKARRERMTRNTLREAAARRKKQKSAK